MPIARPSGRLVAALLVLALALAAVAGPAGAESPPSGDPAPAFARDPRIIGGDEAPAGAWPSVVGVMYRYGNVSELNCGGTLIDPSWVLTAGHCVSEGPRWVVPADQLRIRVGSQDLAHGGRDVRVLRVVVRPTFSYETTADDVALIQLATPVGSARPLEVASPTDIPPAGATLTAVGWGLADLADWELPTELRQVDLPALGGPACQEALTLAAEEFGSPPWHHSHLCTGPLGSGGRGTCYGDSGSPLVWERDGRKIIVGITSWLPAGCASPEAPSVFGKVAAHSRWIADTIRYGPHRAGREFAFATALSYLDYDLERGPALVPAPGEPGAYIAAQHTRPRVTRRDATIVRLYQAILGRPAEAFGYQYWQERMFYSGFDGLARYDATRVAEVMARSAEFQGTYGALSDEDFVAQIYLNVLGRTGAAGDVAYWAGRLSAGDSRGKVAGLIAESPENRARTQAGVDVQVAFLNMLRRAPAAYERARWDGQPLDALGRFLVHTYAYARLWAGFRLGGDGI